jgi:UDP-glucose:(heptosyl)LPS alpha-1,3-glucosyltransferase
VSKYKLAFALVKYFEFGGVQRTALRIASECARRGHDVHFFTGEWSGQCPTELSVHVIGAKALTNHGSRKKFATSLRQATTNQGFDCVAGFTKIPGLDVYYAGETCYAARVDETRRWVYKSLPRYRGLKKLEKAVFDADSDTEIILVAHAERDKFIHYYGTDSGRFHLLPPGINKNRLVRNILTEKEKPVLRDKLGLASDDYMLLNVGSRFKTKGIDRAIIALATLPEDLKQRSKLFVVGDDNAKPFVTLAKTQGVGDQVIFVGACEDIADYYYAADLLVHPSYTESAGATLIEAMICGLPVLVTENCGFAFHVQNARAGMICPSPFRQDTLNKMLAEMLVSNKRSQWSSNGSAYCERTDLYSLVEGAADVIIARAARNRAKS